jgi:hypothetical protein
MGVRKGDLLQGTLDLFVLKVLGAGPNHGYGIAMLERATGVIGILSAARRLRDAATPAI